MVPNDNILIKDYRVESTHAEEPKASIFQEKITWLFFALAIGAIILALSKDWFVIGLSGIAFLIGLGIFTKIYNPVSLKKEVFSK